MIVVTDDDPILGDACTKEFADYLWTERKAFTGDALGIEHALEQLKSCKGRTCLLDMGDNVGGGSPGDATTLAQALIHAEQPKSFVCIYDSGAAKEAADAGVGASTVLTMGGKIDNLHGAPLVSKIEVLGIYDGRFKETEARHGGFSVFDQGHTAVVRTESDLTVMLTSKRIPPWSLAQFTCCDLEPEFFDVLVAKGVNSPLAAYGPMCRNFIKVNTPGVTSSDLKVFSYKARRVPMFPFNPDMDWNPY